MIGPLEIVIVVLILVIFFGGYKVLPRLGRSAGKGVREGGEKVKELATKASERAERIDTDRLARRAGEGAREVRELREAVTGSEKRPAPGEKARDDAPTGPEGDDRPGGATPPERG